MDRITYLRIILNKNIEHTDDTTSLISNKNTELLNGICHNSISQVTAHFSGMKLHSNKEKP